MELSDMTEAKAAMEQRLAQVQEWDQTGGQQLGKREYAWLFMVTLGVSAVFLIIGWQL